VIEDRPGGDARDPAATRAALRERLAAMRAPRGDVPARGQPLMLATPEARPFSRPGWLFEIKYDGVRVLACRRGEVVELLGRSGQDVTARYPEVARALLALAVDSFLIDGEIVAFDGGGRPSFQRLQARMGLTVVADVERGMRDVPVTGVFFDCLAADGRDLRERPLTDRKACLADLLPAAGVARYGDHVADHGEAFFEAASRARLEGIVAKRGTSRYAGGRSRDWIKIKCQLRQEFVVGGYTDPQGSRGHFGALHIGLYEGPVERPRLVYVCKVGTGFDEKTLRALLARLAPLARGATPFDVGSPAGHGHHWVEPALVCEVRFTEWTDEGGLRHPTFLGLREDKRPQECRKEAPAAAPGSVAPATAPAASSADAPRVRLTNLGKVFWPREGFTKGDLVAYYDAVAPLLLPYLADRPVVLTRYPDGIEGKSFFQKDAPEFVPSWVRTETIFSKDTGRDIAYFILDDARSLRFVANMATIPLHFWSARLAALDRPDWLVIDLDPKEAPFTDVVAVATALRRILDELELPSYPKTSGATGLHILVPLGARYSHEETRNFARLIALLGVEATPGISTVARPVRDRGGKVYIDFGQNGHGVTIVAPYSVRPRPAAPASCPLLWSEVTARLDPSRFTIRTIPARFERMDDPMRAVLGSGIDMAAALARVEARMSATRAAPGRRPRRRA
jgi:bifunctional non-homologous end joining protein LigD